MELVRVRPRAVDAAVATVLAGAAVGQLWAGADPELASARWGVLPLALLPPLALLARRRRPLAVVAVVTGCFVMQAVGVAPSALLAQVASALVAVYSVAAHSTLRVSLVGFLVGCAGPVVLAVASGDSAAGIASIAVFAGVPWVAGRTVRRVRDYADALERTALALEEERERTARLAVVETRQHIARELHDVLAHGVGLMTVQAGGARRLVDRDPERVRAALQVIEDAGRDALTELRLLLDGLDPQERDTEAGSAPTLDGALRLLQETAGTAHPVEVRRSGIPAPLSPGLDLALCRIVQEAVANAVRHAPGAAVAVEVEFDADGVAVRVRNGHAAGGVHTFRPGGGRGLMGMRERAALYGGSFSAGYEPDGGFLVEARVPLPVRGTAS